MPDYCGPVLVFYPAIMLQCNCMLMVCFSDYHQVAVPVADKINDMTFL